MRPAELAEALAGRGFIPSDAEPLPFGAAGRPWYLSAVLGGAGWLASLSAFAFVMLLFEPDTTADYLVGGVLLLGSGYGLYRIDRDSAFFEQLALALSLAGQLVLIWAVGDATESAAATAGFAAAMSAGLVVLLPNHFARALSAFFACIAATLAIRTAWWGEDALWNQRLDVALVPALVGWAVVWIPVGLGVRALVAREREWMATGTRAVARPALTGLLLALCLGTWTSEPFAALAVWTPTGGATTSWLTLWPLLGVGAALYAAVAAYRVRHRAMIGVAVAGALLHVVQFYYLLGVRLVTKSYIMIAVGIVLLLAARSVRLGSSRPDPGSPPAVGSDPARDSDAAEVAP